MVAGTVAAVIDDSGIYTPGRPGRCGNTVIVDGADGATYTYCHLAAVLVIPGQAVTAGALVGATGGAAETPGAGNTTGPHLHLAIRVYGQSVCPQPILLALIRGNPIPPGATPTTGCTTTGTATDWSGWLEELIS